MNGYFIRFADADGIKTKGSLILRGFKKEELDIEARKQIAIGWNRVNFWQHLWFRLRNKF